MPQTPQTPRTPQPQPPQPPQTLQVTIPNLYHLSGQHMHMTYSSTGLDGQPTLTYQDDHQGKTFRGEEVRVMETDLGTLVSVTIRMTIDMGSTSLSLLIPYMQISQGTSAAVHTYCVTTLHSFSIAPQLSRGQLDTYSMTELQGTAQFVYY
jgi:hypothetical protein